jgi:hypothetical protein
VERGEDLAWFSAPRAIALQQSGTSLDAAVADVTARLRKAYTIGARAAAPRPLVIEVIR